MNKEKNTLGCRTIAMGDKRLWIVSLYGEKKVCWFNVYKGMEARNFVSRNFRLGISVRYEMNNKMRVIEFCC